MHKAANDHTLPSLLKERYGGLKKFLQNHQDVFFLGDDHPYNPHVSLTASKAGPLNSGSLSGLESRKLKTKRERKLEAGGVFFDPAHRGDLTPIVAMDCEMVGVGLDASQSSLARCSIVNCQGAVIYDKHVKQIHPVSDYRTHVSGIRPKDLVDGEDFSVVQQEVAQILHERILVGHSLQADLQALGLNHSRQLIRDTAYYQGLCPNRPRSLKTLVKERLGVEFQAGEHDSVEDARAVLAVYKTVAMQWEHEVAEERLRDWEAGYNSSNGNTNGLSSGGSLSSLGSLTSLAGPTTLASSGKASNTRMLSFSESFFQFTR